VKELSLFPVKRECKGEIMADKQRIKYLQEHIPMIETRIRSGKWMFGDHRRLKEMKAELASIKVK
jgi:hypothetical protein